MFFWQLRAVGNIVSGDELQTQVMLNVSVLPCLLALLHSPRKGIKKEACWTISNITAGNALHIQAVMDAGIVPHLIDLLSNDEFDIKKEAAWAIANATARGSPKQIRYLVACNGIKPMAELLASSDQRIVLVCLETLANILKVGEVDSKQTGEPNKFALAVEAVKGIDKLDQLTTHANPVILEKASRILDTYF